MILNKNMLRCSLLLLACTFLLITCSKEKQKTLNQDKLVLVLSELMLIENMAVEDSTKARLIHESLDKHSVSLKKLKSTIDKFEDKPEYWQNIYSRVTENLKADTGKFDIQKK